MDRPGSTLSIERVREFYESDVVLRTFNDSFSGRWHTRVVPDAPGPKSSEAFVADLLGLGPEHLVLDFGCGVGLVACSLAERTGCSIRGLNISPKQIAQAGLLRDLHGLGGQVRFDVYPGGRLPYPDDAFDRIYFFESPCHVPDKRLMARELFRVLRPGGACAGQDWVVTGDRIPGVDYATWIRPIEECCEVALGSLQQYRDLFAEAGFVNLESVDARTICQSLRNSFAPSSDPAVRVSADDSVADRLAKGNLALSNAYDRGLFTIGFLRAEKPARSTLVQYRVRADGTDLETGRVHVYAPSKNASVIRFHTAAFDVSSTAWLRAFEDLVDSSERATTEASCKVAGGERHCCRFNLFFHENTRDGYGRIRDYLARGAATTGVRSSTSLLDEFVAEDLDFTRVSKVVTGLDLRPALADSRLKVWFMLSGYPERVERAMRLQNACDRVGRLALHDGFLVGFDLHLDGRESVKLYPSVRREDLAHPALSSALSENALGAMQKCSLTHVYFAQQNRPVVFQFHPDDPDAFVREYLCDVLAQPIHSRYQGHHLLDMVVALRESDLGGEATDFSLYYMPATERLA